jgi:hypothetical protein
MKEWDGRAGDEEWQGKKYGLICHCLSHIMSHVTNERCVWECAEFSAKGFDKRRNHGTIDDKLMGLAQFWRRMAWWSGSERPRSGRCKMRL